MNRTEQIAQTLRSRDPFVSEDTIKNYEVMCINYNLTDMQSLDDILLALVLGDKASAGAGKSWLSRLDVIKEVREELEKLTKKKPLKTPIKVENAMAALKIDSSPSGTTPNKSLFSQDTCGSQKIVSETFGKEELMNRFQATNISVKESEKNLKTTNDFLNDPYQSRRQAIVKRIAKMSELYQQYFGKLNMPHFEGFSNLDDFISRDINIFCIGRITTGPTSDNLIENNIYFESYDSQSDRSKVCLLETKNVKQIQFRDGQTMSIDECLFFLNQIVVIEGCYSKETLTFDCKNIFIETCIPEDYNAGKQSASLSSDEGKIFSLMVAGGPFMPQSSFDLSPLNEFLKRVIDVKPNFVIILGPFLDQNNEIIKKGEIKFEGSDIYLDYYRAFEPIMNFIEDRLKTLPNTSAIIVPSLLDAHHFYPYPQQPFLSEKSYSKIKFVSNPSQICFNKDVKLGITSTDFLFDVIKNSFVRNNASNKFALCLKGVLEQRTFYPVYPSLIPLDMKNYSNIEFDGKPDIILYTSNLPSGIKASKNTVFINYGNLMKSKDTGTYQTIYISTDKKIPIDERIYVTTSKL